MYTQRQLITLLIKQSILKNNIFAIFLVLSMIPSFSPAANDREVVKNVAGFFQRIRSVQATFSIAEGSSIVMRGMLRYVHPGRLRVDLSEPAGKKIISSGRYLFVIDQNSGTVGRQNLHAGAISGGLSFLNSYGNIAVIPSANGYMIRLRKKGATWSQVSISATKNFIPTRIKLQGIRTAGTTITFSNVKTGISFPGKLFDYRVPGNIQMVENPLNLK